MGFILNPCDQPEAFPAFINGNLLIIEIQSTGTVEVIFDHTTHRNVQMQFIQYLQCDIDHPTQSMADLAWLREHFGSLENLKGKKIAMTWAYSPSYGKPLSVPQGAIGLFTLMGMDVVLAHPEGYEFMEEVEEVAW